MTDSVYLGANQNRGVRTTSEYFQPGAHAASHPASTEKNRPAGVQSQYFIPSNTGSTTNSSYFMPSGGAQGGAPSTANQGRPTASTAGRTTGSVYFGASTTGRTTGSVYLGPSAAGRSTGSVYYGASGAGQSTKTTVTQCSQIPTTATAVASTTTAVASTTTALATSTGSSSKTAVSKTGRSTNSAIPVGMKPVASKSGYTITLVPVKSRAAPVNSNVTAAAPIAISPQDNSTNVATAPATGRFTISLLPPTPQEASSMTAMGPGPSATDNQQCGASTMDPIPPVERDYAMT